MESNISENVTPKLVGMIVAIIVLACVMIPICNSLVSDGNGSSGGGGGESEKVVLNTLSDEYGVDFSPYKSYEIYTKDTTLTLPTTISLTLEDLQNYKDVCSSVDWTTAHLEGYLFTIFVSKGETESVWIDYNTRSKDIEVNVQSATYYLNKISAFSLTVSTDYTLTYSFIHDGSTIEGTFQSKYIQSLSDSEYGFVLTTGVISEKFTVGSQLGWWAEYDDTMYEGVISITEDMISDNTLSFNTVANGYTFVYSLNIQSTDTEGVWQFTEPLYNYQGTTGYDQNNNLVQNANHYVNLITTYGYTQSDSGSGSATLNNPEPYSMKYSYAEGTIPDFSIDVATDMQTQITTVTTENGTVTINPADTSKNTVSHVLLATENSFIGAFAQGIIYANEEGTIYLILGATIQCANGQISLVLNEGDTILDVSSMSPVSGNVALGTVEWCYYADPNGDYGNYADTQIGNGLYYDSTKPLCSIGNLGSKIAVYRNMEVSLNNPPTVTALTYTPTTSDNLFKGASWPEIIEEEETVDAYFTILPTSISADNGGNGGDGNTGGVSGISATIIKLLPVFVAIGLILAMVSMFYDPKNLIRGQQ